MSKCAKCGYDTTIDGAHHCGPLTQTAAMPQDKYPGMSLRDYFAAHASEQDISAWLTTWDGESTQRRSREQAKYAYADSMIAERVRLAPLQTTQPPASAPPDLAAG
jgi:ribulose 1,5-bisphosphate carboxylase large subunit-like protein